ncbi:MAG TPA: rhomboid family intramembrane serine protease [Bacteroidales bacterium]|nr:rhomboid family intramembrane serine protease [Bacteroidales bacterium]
MTIAIVIITSIISIIAFNNPDLFARLQFNPYQVYHRKEFYRLFTHAFLHADWIHLIVNMLVLFSFGMAVEGYFDQLAAGGYLAHPKLSYLILYVSSVIISSLVTLFKHKDNAWYNSVGASGAVSAVLFTSIFFAPMHKVLFYAILPIPGIIFGVLYLIYSQYMSRRNRDNINHDAHFVGAVFGFIYPLFIDPSLFSWFISQVFH